ncbi:MAG: hypothetical protein ACKVUT_17375 [Gaiella sp.]
MTTLVAAARERETGPQLCAALAAGARDIVVQLQSHDMDADTLMLLYDATRALREVDGRLIVVADDPGLRRLLALTLLDQTLDVRDPASFST